MNLSEVIGQEVVKGRLIQMIRKDRLPHALLFCGLQGAGKMVLAIAFANYLLVGDEIEEATSSTVSNACVMPRNWGHPDLYFSYPTIKLPSMSGKYQPVSTGFVKEWHGLTMQGTYFAINQQMSQMGATMQQAIITGVESDELSHVLALKSGQGGYKVSIIWLPKRMNLTSTNKLLKPLEESLQGTIFLMVCEEPEKLLETIVSRIQCINVKRINDETIEQVLINKRRIDIGAAYRIIHTTNGSWLKALEVMDSGSENRKFYNMFQMPIRLCYLRNIKDLKRWSGVVAGYGCEKERRILIHFQQQVRENFVLNFRMPELNYTTLEEENFAKNFARFISETNVIEISELPQRVNRDTEQNVSAKIVFYDMALKLVVLSLKKQASGQVNKQMS